MLCPLAVTCGDPAGVGPEITLAAWTKRSSDSLQPFYVIGDAVHYKTLAKKLGLDVPITIITEPAQALTCFEKSLPVFHQALTTSVTLGIPNPDNAPCVIASIDTAVDHTQKGHAAGLITTPIHKASLMSKGFAFPGHTDYLGHLTKTLRPIMMLAVKGLRVVPVTVHLPLKDVAGTLTKQAIVEAGLITARALTTDFGIAAPRLAVAGLNPHAGEEGQLGKEETRIITPAVQALRAAGITTSGPHPADSLMAAQTRTHYDAALCMYHDQALIPLKTLDFYGGVNITLGLPLVRTSPDHGTAFGIAGQGIARPDSLIAAIRQATNISRARQVS